MKNIADLYKQVQQGIRPVVTFLTGIEEKDEYAEAGMRARILGISESRHDKGIFRIEFDYGSFDAHNAELEKPNYYDKGGEPCLTARQAGQYKAQGGIWFDGYEEIASLFMPESEEATQLYAQFTRESSKPPGLTYVKWLESKVLATSSDFTSAQDQMVSVLRIALEYYASGNHFIRHDPSIWDTVSGEPESLFEDESNSATVEDGSIARAALASLAVAGEVQASVIVPGFIKPDNDRQIFFYEQDFYVLSNFSSFALDWRGCRWSTSEAAYHSEKFIGQPELQRAIQEAPSAHEAFKIAELHKDDRIPHWDDVKVDIMRDILRAKVAQHEYVRRKLLETGDRELIEDSWRDDFWGWGLNRDGQNMLGKLWMEVRSELRTQTAATDAGASRE